MVGLGLESGQCTSQPGAPLRPYALSQGRGFTEATLSPFPLPTLTPPSLPIWYRLRAILVPGWLIAVPGDFDLGPEGKRREGAPGKPREVQSSQRERHI